MKFIKACSLSLALALPLAAAQAAAPNKASVLQVAEYSGDFYTLLTAATRAGLLNALADPRLELTLLAPTDEAFAKLPRGTVQFLMDPRNKTELVRFVKNHIVAGSIGSTSFADEPLNLPTLSGDMVKFEGRTIGNANLSTADIVASNGVVHIIDKVLMPGS